MRPAAFVAHLLHRTRRDWQLHATWFEWLYGTTTASGNLPWLRNALVGT
jgi:hypothetical protein